MEERGGERKCGKGKGGGVKEEEKEGEWRKV